MRSVTDRVAPRARAVFGSSCRPGDSRTPALASASSCSRRRPATDSSGKVRTIAGALVHALDRRLSDASRCTCMLGSARAGCRRTPVDGLPAAWPRGRACAPGRDQSQLLPGPTLQARVVRQRGRRPSGVTRSTTWPESVAIAGGWEVAMCRCGLPTAPTILVRPISESGGAGSKSGLRAAHAELASGRRLLVEYKPFEPAFYHTDIADWGMALLLARAAGPPAKVLVDTGHHYLSQNIEQIVAWLLAEGMLGGFHFNDRRYADDDLTLGSIDPYQVFRIFHEIRFFEWETGRAADIAYVIDQSHNLKGKIEAMIQTVVMAQALFVRAALVDCAPLSAAQRLERSRPGRDVSAGRLRHRRAPAHCRVAHSEGPAGRPDGRVSAKRLSGANHTRTRRARGSVELAIARRRRVRQDLPAALTVSGRDPLIAASGIRKAFAGVQALGGRVVRSSPRRGARAGRRKRRRQVDVRQDPHGRGDARRRYARHRRSRRPVRSRPPRRGRAASSRSISSPRCFRI